MKRNLILLSIALTLFSVALVHLGPAMMGKDLLATPLLQGPLLSIDGWSLIHVYSLALSGVTFPGKFGLFFTLSTLFEVFEALMAHGAVDWKFVWQERGINTVWDIFFNILGYRIGERVLLPMYLKGILARVPENVYHSLINQSKTQVETSEGQDVDMLKLHYLVQSNPRLSLHLPSPWWIGLVHMLIVGIPSFLVRKRDFSPMASTMIGSLILLVGWRMDVSARQAMRRAA
jgi:hypothetical protein